MQSKEKSVTTFERNKRTAIYVVVGREKKCSVVVSATLCYPFNAVSLNLVLWLVNQIKIEKVSFLLTLMNYAFAGVISFAMPYIIFRVVHSIGTKEHESYTLFVDFEKHKLLVETFSVGYEWKISIEPDFQREISILYFS